MSVWLAMRWRSFHRWTIDKAAQLETASVGGLFILDHTDDADVAYGTQHDDTTFEVATGQINDVALDCYFCGDQRGRRRYGARKESVIREKRVHQILSALSRDNRQGRWPYG